MRRISSPPAQLQYGATGRSGDPSYSAEKFALYYTSFSICFQRFQCGRRGIFSRHGLQNMGRRRQPRRRRRAGADGAPHCGLRLFGRILAVLSARRGESLEYAVDRHKLRDKARARSGCADDPARLTSHLTHANSAVRIVNAVSATPAPFAVKRGHRKRRAPATSAACGRRSKPERVARENYSALPHRGKPSDNRHYVTSLYVNGKARGTIALHSMKSPPNLCRDTDADTTTQQKTDGQSRRSCLCRCAVG